MRHTTETILSRIHEVFADDSKLAYIVYHNSKGAGTESTHDLRNGQLCTIENIDKLDTKAFFSVKLSNDNVQPYRHYRVSGVHTITVRNK